MGDVVEQLGTATLLDLPPEKVLNGALEANLDLCMVIGFGPNGLYHASSTSDIAEMVFRLEMFKMDLLSRAAEGVKR